MQNGQSTNLPTNILAVLTGWRQSGKEKKVEGRQRFPLLFGRSVNQQMHIDTRTVTQRNHRGPLQVSKEGVIAACLAH